jgi:hypothetical protein
VLDEYVSVAAARESYGVVVTGTAEECNVEVDLKATEKLRKKLLAERGSAS